MTTTPPPASSSELRLDDLVDATPASRDRYVDLLRAVSIAVVVLWHWVFSVTHWHDGRLTMPNPVQWSPWLWPATWVLQIMPVFFFVGGYANAASWGSVQRQGGGFGRFARLRLERLLRPLVAFAVVWTAIEIAMNLAHPEYTGVLHYGWVVFVPLWFLAVYTAVVLLTPAATALHRRFGAKAVVGLGVAIALADLGRFAFGLGALGYANCALVFVFIHQLGFLYHDGTLGRIGRRGQAALAIGGLTALAVMTGFGPYPHSMVAIGQDPIGNMFPTTAAIAALAVFQVGLVMLLRPAATRLLARRRVWRGVVAANGVAMSVFVWHMTALLAVIEVVRLAGLQLGDTPSASWWATRPVWLLGPALVLAALVACSARFERLRMPGLATR